MTGERLSGQKAQAKIEALMADVDITNDSQEAIASAIASKISQQSYTKFEFETEFTNRRKIEFKLNGVTQPTPPANTSAIQEFEVEVKYGKNKVELDYEVKRGAVKAKYRNDLTGEYLTGRQAQVKIEGIMTGMEFRGASRSNITSYIIDALGTGNHYREFEFEVKYADRTKIEFES